MNISRISRIALLSAIFAAPAFASQAPEGQKPEGQKTETTTPAPTNPDVKPATGTDVPKADPATAVAPTTPATGTDASKADTSKAAAPATADATKPATEESTFEKAKNIAAAPFVFMLATAPDKVANFTKLNDVLNYVTDCSMFSKDGFFKKHAANGNFGRGIVLFATAAALIVAYNKFVADNADADDNDVFEMNDEVDADQQ